MRKSIVATAAITVVLAIGAPARNATAAMPIASADQLGLAADLTEKAAVICGPWGCYWRPYWGVYRPYPVWGWRRRYWGWGGPGWGWRRPWGWGGPGWGWRRRWW
jgi:hypothetical protein